MSHTNKDDHLVEYHGAEATASHSGVPAKSGRFSTPIKPALVLDMDEDVAETSTPPMYVEKDPLIGHSSPVQRGLDHIKGVVRAMSRKQPSMVTLDVSAPHKERVAPYETRERATTKTRTVERLKELMTRLAYLEQSSADAALVDESIARLEDALKSKANVGELEPHIRPYARALEETQRTVGNLHGSLGLNVERVTGLETMQSSLGESLATQRANIEEVNAKLDTFKASITQAAATEHESSYKQFSQAQNDIQSLKDSHATLEQQFKLHLSGKVVRLEQHIQQLQAQFQENQQSQQQRQLHVDQVLARLSSQISGLQGTVSQGPPQDPNGPPHVPQATVNQVQQAVLDAQQAKLVAQQAQETSLSAQRLSQQAHTSTQQLRVEIQEVRGEIAATSTEAQRSLEIARNAQSTSSSAQSVSQGMSEQLGVVHTGLQVAEKQIRQLESNGARGALPDFQTLNEVKAATDQTVQAVAELRVTAGQAKRVAEQAVECAENTQRGIISYESRLGVVEGAMKAHPRAPDHASFSAHLETIQKDVHAALARAIGCAENAAKAEAESEEHVSFAQGQRQVMEELVARCQGLHSELMATVSSGATTSSPPPPPPPHPTAPPPHPTVLTPHSTAPPPHSTAPPQAPHMGYGTSPINQAWSAEGSSHDHGRGGHPDSEGSQRHGHPIWRPPSAATFPQAHQFVETSQDYTNMDVMGQLAPYFEGQWFIPSRAVDPPPNVKRKKIRPTGIGEGFAFHGVQPFMVAVMELKALPHDRNAQMPMGFFGREGHPMIDSKTVQVLQDEYKMPVWRDLENQEQRERWEKEWSRWVGVRLDVVDRRTLVGCLLVSIPTKIHDHFFERVMREDLDLFTLWKEVFRYGRRFRNIYRTEPVWKALRLEGHVGPMEWCDWFTKWLEKGSQVIGGVTRMQAHSQLPLVLDEYCDDKRAGRQMPWKMIGEKLYGEPAQQGYGFNYLELYVWVMDFLTQEEDSRRARENLRGSTQSVSAVTRTCHHCGSPDHVQRDCPKENANACHNCGAKDHYARDCPHPRRMRCYHCGGPHRAAECPNKSATGQPRSASNSRGRPDDRRSRSGSQPRERSQPRGGSQPRDQYQKRGFTPERRPSMTSQQGRGQEHHQRRGFTPERRPSSASHRGQGPHKTPERRPSSGSARGLGSPSPVKQ